MHRIVCRRFGASISPGAAGAGFKNDRGVTESVKPRRVFATGDARAASPLARVQARPWRPGRYPVPARPWRPAQAQRGSPMTIDITILAGLDADTTQVSTIGRVTD
ncbi:MAG: hypothetical protein EOP02_14355, partial [Proteobacteria bacterium]